MKVVIIGCTHAGTITASQVLSQHPDAEVTIYEKNDNVSFLSCGIATYLGGVAKSIDDMFYSSPEALAQLGAAVHMQHEVTAVDLKKKTLKVKNLVSGEESEDYYDKLMVTTGSWPVIPNLPGIDDPNVYLCKNYNHAKKLFEVAKNAQKIVVIGGGYIGVELVEAYSKQGKQVTLIDGNDRLLSKYYDAKYTDIVTKDFEDHQVTLAFDELVAGFEHKDQGVVVKTNKGSYDADIAILCIGFRPNTGLFKDQLEFNADGSIKTNAYMQTSDPDVYGAGDSVAVHYNPTNQEAYVPLATNAVRQGIIAGTNLYGNTMTYMGTQSTSGLQLYDNSMSSTGMTLESARAAGFDADAVTFEDNYRPEFMPTNAKVIGTVVWDRSNNQILGAQFMSKLDISMYANAVSVMIQNHNTINFMAMVDMLFQPNFDRPFNFINLLGQQAVAKAVK
ncbi:MAG: FAD-dependent oxidoreductase [Limosilactobacillus oris]|jgi:NADPH-dependent 2,4-dienoyl-CoA reductase/sulfur reductase-like enzyme|uniref:FAD-dependent oxidoreductase n=1 Tax=Limosilactobacillus oris TaxID=1632 RepID=UPI000789FC11|nr:FAD-dependent oxidoreductase [Limosilactobacillus oris]AMS07633.1 NADH oxidase [Limosilactobacillus oris]MCH3910471.1 FAD-dependent oxidoreductase [Limosilactobacillus oris]MCH3939596.1 FAD-dependent oxidoreductase [Limosilactobacillus oris]MCI1981359.1 FAD-dependent oxidoreductase [Limosilactobacillus oris]UXC67024.1 FAD-dependent oxidoreductase [Limosilactobacillus oris]